MKICFLTLKNPEDRTSWSGIFYQMFINLKRYHEVEWIGTVKLKLWQKAFLKAIHIYNKKLNYKVPLSNILFSKYYAKNVKQKLEQNKYDIIFAPVSSTLFCYLETSIPIVYLSDTTFELMVDYYPEFTGIDKKNIEKGNDIDKKAFAKMYKVLFGSQWAANSAINYYHVPPEKVGVAEFGANLLYDPELNELDFSDKKVCNILFLGVNWKRKGGDIAYKTYLKLKSQNFHCTFTVIGCSPDINTKDPDVTIIPFINKNEKSDFDRLYKILLQTHFLLLPTKAECFGIVFSEASAFAIPSVTSNTGGVPSAVENGVNGFLLNVNSDENAFADKIYSVYNNKELYKNLRLSSRKQFEKKLNWSAWTEKFNDCIKPLKK